MPDKIPSRRKRTTERIVSAARKHDRTRSMRETAPSDSVAPENLPQTIGNLFRSAREVQRLSQEQVAELTSGSNGQITRATVSSIERGRCMPGLEVLVSMSRVLNVAPTEVLERIDLADRPPVDLSNISIEELKEQAENFFWAGNYRSALAAYDAMLERLVLDPPEDHRERRRLQARFEISRAVTLRRCSALKTAHASAQRAIQGSQEFPELQAEAYMVLASLLSHGGLSVLAVDAVNRAVELAEAGNERLQGRAWTQRGDVFYRSGDLEQARKAFLQAIPLTRKARDFHNLVKLEGNIGACLFDLKRHAQAHKRFVKAVDLARKYADPAAEAFWLVDLGRLALAQGKLEDADRQARAALRIAKPKDHLLTTFRAEWLRHLVVREKDPVNADRHRMAYLRKLYPRVKEHKTFRAVAEFAELVLDVSRLQEPS